VSAFTVFAFLVLAFTSAFAQGPGVSKLTIKSSVLNEERVILVRTPAGYDASKTTYPVLYMTDGDAHMAHTASSVEFFARNGRTSELIVVGITNTDCGGRTPLEDSIDVYAEAMAHLKACHAVLDRAEKRLEIVRRSVEGGAAAGPAEVDDDGVKPR
jgi:enterochelin esterase-like enzyme